MSLTTVVLTKNEEKNITDCLESLKWCDELVIVDDFSEDNSVKISEKLGAKVYQHQLDNDFAQQRNFGLKKTKGDWVLFVDADERVSPELKKEIIQTTKLSKFNGFYLKRTDYLFGKQLKYGETAKVRLLRLARKGKGEWRRKVHETWEIKGKIGGLKNPLFHYPHPTISDFIKQVNFHSTLHAEALRKEGVKPSLFRIIANPLGKFIQNYFFRLGFLDGMPGLIMALMMSFHSFLARAKLHFLNNEKN